MEIEGICCPGEETANEEEPLRMSESFAGSIPNLLFIFCQGDELKPSGEQTEQLMTGNKSGGANIHREHSTA